VITIGNKIHDIPVVLWSFGRDGGTSFGEITLKPGEPLSV